MRLAITTPSKACERLRVPSTTLTLTMSVSPGAKSGTTLFAVRRAISSCSIFSMRFIYITPYASFQRSSQNQFGPERGYENIKLLSIYVWMFFKKSSSLLLNNPFLRAASIKSGRLNWVASKDCSRRQPSIMA